MLHLLLYQKRFYICGHLFKFFEPLRLRIMKKNLSYHLFLSLCFLACGSAVHGSVLSLGDESPSESSSESPFYFVPRDLDSDSDSPSPSWQFVEGPLATGCEEQKKKPLAITQKFDTLIQRVLETAPCELNENEKSKIREVLFQYFCLYVFESKTCYSHLISDID